MALFIDDPNSRTRREQHTAEHSAYLKTSLWRAKRDFARRRAGYACERCGSKRDIEVHHKTYERLGHEPDSDLEVLCRRCHGDHHYEEKYQDPSAVYVKLVSAIVAANPYQQVSDIADEAKRACVKHNLKVDVQLIDKAITLVCGTRLKDKGRPYVSVVDAPREEPITHAQALEWLTRMKRAMGGELDAIVKPMPQPRVVTQARADQLRAFAMLTREMEESIARCEALELQAERNHERTD